VTSAAPTTGADGVATVGSWILGGMNGSNTLTATASGASVTFSATGSAPTDLRGIYVVTSASIIFTSASGVASQAAMAVPGVDGVTLVADWSTLETSRGNTVSPGWTNGSATRSPWGRRSRWQSRRVTARPPGSFSPRQRAVAQPD